MQKKNFRYGYFCQSCRTELQLDSQVLYVEEEMGRYFCSEECINNYYRPMAEYYFRELVANRDPHDIPDTDFDKFQEYGSLCMEDPKEVWAEESESGEVYYYFHAEFSNEVGKFTYIVMCFCLNFDPTYILISFPTRDANLVKQYSRGKQIDIEAAKNELLENSAEEASVDSIMMQSSLDSKAMAIEEEMLRYRKASDIDREDFEDYSHLLDETIENPDEAWELENEEEDTVSLTLIAHPEDDLHFVVICTLDAGEEEEEMVWRVLYYFPTNDEKLLEHFRRGVMREGNSSTTGEFVH